jgi:hypothetical protein
MRSINSNNHPKRQWAANRNHPISSTHAIPIASHPAQMRHATSNATLATLSTDPLIYPTTPRNPVTLYTTPHAHGSQTWQDIAQRTAQARTHGGKESLIYREARRPAPPAPPCPTRARPNAENPSSQKNSIFSSFPLFYPMQLR